MLKLYHHYFVRITTWSPLRHWNVGKGSKVAVVGLGGLYHMAIKLANALGAEVTLFTRSAKQRTRCKTTWRTSCSVINR